jgi:hypothetical protein
VELLAGMTIGGALMSALGVGVGALVRRQTAAIVGVFVYLLVIEALLNGLLLKAAEVRFNLSAAMAELTATTETAGIDNLDHPLGQVAGGLVLLAWVAVFVVVGALVMQNRDVTD